MLCSCGSWSAWRALRCRRQPAQKPRLTVKYLKGGGAQQGFIFKQCEMLFPSLFLCIPFAPSSRALLSMPGWGSAREHAGMASTPRAVCHTLTPASARSPRRTRRRRLRRAQTTPSCTSHARAAAAGGPSKRWATTSRASAGWMLHAAVAAPRCPATSAGAGCCMQLSPLHAAPPQALARVLRRRPRPRPHRHARALPQPQPPTPKTDQ